MVYLQVEPSSTIVSSSEERQDGPVLNDNDPEFKTPLCPKESDCAQITLRGSTICLQEAGSDSLRVIPAPIVQWTYRPSGPVIVHWVMPFSRPPSNPEEWEPLVLPPGQEIIVSPERGYDGRTIYTMSWRPVSPFLRKPLLSYAQGGD